MQLNETPCTSLVEGGEHLGASFLLGGREARSAAINQPDMASAIEELTE
jgi:hypothetical protein